MVGADGVTSAIARGLRPSDRQHVDVHRAVALRAYITDLEEIEREVEFYLYDEILPGYAWIFPAGMARLILVLACALMYSAKVIIILKDMLQDFLDLPQIKPRLKRGGEVEGVKIWQLNFGSQKKLQHVFDGATP